MMILFADDEKDTVGILMAYFQRSGLTDLAAVHTPQEAVAYIQQNKPKLVFLDITFGEAEPMTGIDVLKIVRKTTPSSRIIMLSAHDHLRDESMAHGADDYIQKPYRIRSLVDIAKKVEALP